MKNLLTTLVAIMLCLQAFANWTTINSTIQDELTCITFRNNLGLISGKKGAYYSTDGGTTSTSWIRAHSYFNSSDSLAYNHSQFYGCFSEPNSAKMFLCGKDTVTQKAVIFSFNPANFQLHLEYTGTTNSKLNKIAFYNYSSTYYAVGDNGLLVTFTNSGNFQVYATGFTHDMNSVTIVSNTMIIGARNCLIETPLIFASLSFSVEPHANRNFKDYTGLSNTGDYAAIATNFSRRTYSNYSEPHDYFADSLSGNDLFFYNGSMYIGTNAGIYKTYGTSDVIEYQPTSGTASSLCITSNSANTLMFSVGKNGTILYSNALGGVPRPYAHINASGGCVNTFLSVTPTSGTVTGCSWAIDNVPNASPCNFLSYNANVIGTHTIRYIFSNSLYTDTVYKTFHVVPVPSTNNLISLSDSILCHAEMVDVTIHNSQPDVFYTLRKSGSGIPFSSSGTGTGSDLTFTSSLISQAGNYYLIATSSLASCSANLPVFPILVEKTKADFHTGLINAEHNEPTPFYEHCSETAFYEWSFSNQPDAATSSLADPVIGFAQNGQSSVQLIATSINGCPDTIIKPGPFIYEEPVLTDSCFLMTVNGAVRPWGGNYNPDIDHLCTTTDGGYVISGKADVTYFQSKYGTGLQTDFNGMYLAKYTGSGVLKWIVRSSRDVSGLYWEYRTNDLKEDDSASLYLTGTVGVTGYWPDRYMVDNRGDTIQLTYSYLLKFNRNGLLTWERGLNEFDAAQFTTIAFDNDNNLYTPIYHMWADLGAPPPIPIYANHLPVATIPLSTQYQGPFSNRYYITKMTPNGDYLDNFMVQLDRGDYPRILFDTTNNLVVCGNAIAGGQFEVPATGQFIDLPYNGNSNSDHLYAVKFNNTGNFLWKVYGITDYSAMGLAGDATCSMSDCVLDAAGNLYLTGHNDVPPGTTQYPMKIFNADNSITSFTGGKYFTTKIGSNGMCNWINGNFSTYYGIGTDLILEDNSIKVLAFVNDNPPSAVSTTTFKSPDGGFIDISNYGSQAFFIRYDLNGNLQSILESGPNGGQGFAAFTGPHHFEQLGANSYVWTTNYMSEYLPLGGNVYFGDALPAVPPTTFGDYNYPGLISTFSPACGITSYPSYITYDQHTICTGDVYEFADGTSFTVTDSIFHENVLTTIHGMDSTVRTTIYGYDMGTIAVTSSWDTLHTSAQAASYQWVDCNAGFAAIPGGDTSWLVSAQTGDYAVITQYLECKDTSACFHFEYVHYFLSYDQHTVCSGDSFEFADGTTLAVTDSVYHESIVTATNGDDSIVRTTVYGHQFGTITIAVDQDTLFTNLQATAYQWVDCNAGYAIIPGADSSRFRSGQTGDYAVILQFEGCTDTSACFHYVEPSFETDDQYTVCSGELFEFADGTILPVTDSVYHESQLITSQGYDSIVRTTVYGHQFTTIDVASSHDTISTTTIADAYQWVNCTAGYAAIQGADGPWFVSAQSGDYAVILQFGDCADTSACFHYDYVPYFVTYDEHTICSGNVYEFADGTTLPVTDSVYHESIVTATNGDDSIVRTTVYGYEFGTISVTQVSLNMLATTTEADWYVWLQCDDVPIFNFTDYLMVGTTGDYAVVVNVGECRDTSACFHYEVPVFHTYDQHTICSGDVYEFIDGTVLTVTDSVYHESLLTSSGGYDSIVGTTVYGYEFGTIDVTQTAFNMLSTTTEADGYLWLLCDDVLIINTTNFLMVGSTGDYAVIVYVGECRDTSECFHYDWIGLDENTGLELLSLYPNPSQDVVTISSGAPMDGWMLKLVTEDGRLLQTESLNALNYQLTLDYPAGTYFVEITTQDGAQKIFKLVRL